MDLTDPQHRPDLFEAHGTGMLTGDPIEAGVISRAFFGGREAEPSFSPLHVGSAKTVLGHTEGIAGILGVMKVSLAMQHGRDGICMDPEKLPCCGLRHR